MIKTLFENGGVYFIIASIASLGLVFRVLEVLAFKSMVSKKNKKETTGKGQPTTFLTFLKTDYTKKHLTGKKVNNVEAFVDKHMINKSFCKMSIITCKKICNLMLILAGIATVILGILGSIEKRGDNEILSVLFVGAISVGTLLIIDCLIAYEDRIRRYKVSIVSHIENEYEYYISAMGEEEKEKSSADFTSTRALRQKRRLMEEKESKGLEEFKEGAEVNEIKTFQESKEKDVLRDTSENNTDLDIKISSIKGIEKNDDEKMVDEIIKGLFAG